MTALFLFVIVIVLVMFANALGDPWDASRPTL